MSVAEVVEIIVREGKSFPLPWAVEQRLWKRGLRVAPDDPIWLYLFDTCQKIEAFLRSYLTLNPIVTLLDLDADLATCLRSYCIPTLAELRRNPEEISLPVLEHGPGGNATSEQGFDAFGLGPLVLHPQVMSIFGAASPRAVSIHRVVEALSSYNGELESFGRFLARQHGVVDLRKDLNVSIDPVGLNVYSGVLLQAQETFRHGMDEALAAAHSRHTSTPVSHAAVVKFKSRRLKSPSEDSAIAVLLESCRAALKSPYAPSFSKLKRLVERMEFKAEEVTEIVTEYLMLHVGSRKYRQAQYEEDVSMEEPASSKNRGVKRKDEAKDTTKQRKRPTIETVKTEKEYAMLYLSNPDVVKEVPNATLSTFVPSVAGLNQGDARGIGRWGEALVYQYLLREYRDYSVEWLNEKTESRTAYDIKLTCKLTNSLKSTRFIEGKSRARATALLIILVRSQNNAVWG